MKYFIKSKNYFLIFVLIFYFSGLHITKSFGQGLVVDITEGNVQPLKVAISNFVGNDGDESEIGNNIVRVISDDLVSSGLFESIDQAAFIEKPKSPRIKPNFVKITKAGFYDSMVHNIDQILK